MAALTRLGIRSVLLAIFALMLAAFFPGNALAQDQDTPKVDLFVGYQWLHPGGTVPAPAGDPNNPPSYKIPDEGKGFGSALTYNFDPHWGAEADFGFNWGDSNRVTTFSVGPRFMVRTDNTNYFLHALLGYNRLKVTGLDGNNGLGAIVGGGMDLKFSPTISWRLFEVDYVWSRHNYADAASLDFPDLRRASLEGARLRTGIVWSWGYPEAVTPAASCSVQPSEVMVGEPVTATVAASNFNPKHVLTYTWSGNGGKLTGKDTTASIDTNGVAGGSYTVSAQVTDAKMKKSVGATCTASFTVKEPPKNPPTVSLSADPSTVEVGGKSSISATCTSPDNVSVSTASWSASGGSVSGSGSTATLDTTGASPGSITVSATCTDSRGLSSMASTAVTVNAPPPPPAPVVDKVLEARLALHSIYFVTAKPTAAKPDGGLVLSQQKTLIALATDFKKYLEAKPDAHLTLEGHADHRGSDAYNQALSERRVARVKSFLVENGVPEGDIETKAFGKQHNLTSDEVKQSVEQNSDLTPEERGRALRNLVTIRMASNRRVDVTLNAAGQTENSVRQYPFNAADSMTLIGGREADRKAAKPMAKKKAAPKKKQ